MTFKEYVGQKNPQKQHYFTVQVTDDDVENKYLHYGKWFIELKINSVNHTYILHNDSLYTMDEDGNRDKPTVFYFKNNK